MMDTPRISSSLIGHNVAYSRLNSRQRYVIPGLVCLMIAVALERVTFYIVTTNISYFFVDLNTTNSNSAPITTYLVFTGTTDFLPLFGGMIGDSMMSRYACTLVGFLVEGVGSIFLLILMILSEEYPKLLGRSADLGLLFTGLTLMAIGLGLHRVNILTLGCRQVWQHTEQKENIKAVENFFRGYYWWTNIGSFVASVSISMAIGIDLGWNHTPRFYFGIMQTVCIVLGAFFVMVGKRWYIRTKPDGANLRKLTHSFFRKITSIIRFIQNKLKKITPMYARSIQEEHSTEDEILGHIFKLIIMISNLIMMKVIYALVLGNIFLLQAETMDYKIGKIDIPLQIMNCFDDITVLIVLPIMHFLVTPFLARKKKNIPLLKRIGIGLLFVIASAVTCGTVETVRHHYYLWCSSTCFSVFWQIPQFIFLSLAEIFVFITGYQFMYLESPPNLQGLGLGIFFCLLGLAGYIAQVIIAIVQVAAPSWYPSDFNSGHVEKFLFFLAGMQFFFFLIFVWFAHRYRYKYVKMDDESESDAAEERDCRTPIQTPGAYNSYSSLGTTSTLSIDSQDSLQSMGH